VADADPDEQAELVELLDPVALDEMAFSALGVRLPEEDELAGVAAIGLTMRLWRNTPLEDVHSGRSAGLRLATDIRAAGLSDERATSIRDAWQAARRAGGRPTPPRMAYLGQVPFPDETT
jgi:hypothetical protein